MNWRHKQHQFHSCPDNVPGSCLGACSLLNLEEYANHPRGTTFPAKVDNFWKSSKQPFTPLLSFWQNMLLILKTNAVISTELWPIKHLEHKKSAVSFCFFENAALPSFRNISKNSSILVGEVVPNLASFS